jgi:hypothetical protein
MTYWTLHMMERRTTSAKVDCVKNRAECEEGTVFTGIVREDIREHGNRTRFRLSSLREVIIVPFLMTVCDEILSGGVNRHGFNKFLFTRRVSSTCVQYDLITLLW